jgi:hypothetical protein
MGRSPIYLTDILLLLGARIAASEGQTTAMSGEVRELGYVILLAVGQGKYPASIPFVEPLTQDPNDTDTDLDESAMLQQSGFGSKISKTRH